MSTVIDSLERAQLRRVPAFDAGDRLRVHFQVIEGAFPLHSPKIERIEVAARGDVRRAKLYYLRDRVGKRARVRERRSAGPEVAVERELLHGAAFAEEEGAMPTPEQEAAVLAAAEAEAAGVEVAPDAQAAPEAEAPEADAAPEADDAAPANDE
jgi:large subunit ribosomal protein L19